MIKQLESYKCYVYDLETYKEFFCAVFRGQDGYHTFTIEDLSDLLSFIKDKNKLLIGYNSLKFDDLILKYIVKKGTGITSKEIFKLSQAIIAREAFKQTDLYKELRYQQKKPWGRSADLLECCLKGSNKSERRSLKDIAISLRWPKIQDLPYQPDAALSASEKEEILEYCKNDVQITAEIWNKKNEAFAVRLEMERLFGLDIFEMSDARAGEEIILHRYCELTKSDKFKLKRAQKSTDEIQLSSIIPNSISFKGHTLQALLDDLKSITLVPVRNKDNKLEYFEKTETGLIEFKRLLSLKSIQCILGLGGLHSIDRPGVFKTTTEQTIIDIDVSGYYPEIIRTFKLNPSHLTMAWNGMISEIKELRKKKKDEGNEIAKTGLKVIGLAPFGQTGSEYSWMFDRKVLYGVTLIGELLILTLAEQCEENNIHLLSVNTDGLTVSLLPEQVETFRKLYKAWEIAHDMRFDETGYSVYIRQNVSNYFAVNNETGKIKRKGAAFLAEDMTKKATFDILKKAVLQYFLEGIEPETTIRKSKSLFDFIDSSRMTKGFEAFFNEKQLQKGNRWYVAKKGTGGRLYKRSSETGKLSAMPGSSDLEVIPCNDIFEDSMPENLDLDFYIAKAKAAIEALERSCTPDELKKIKKDEALDRSFQRQKDVIESLQAISLTPYPKNRKKHPSGKVGGKTYQIEDFRRLHQSYPDLGILTGQEYSTLVIDIDHPDVATLLLDRFTETLAIWHGDGSADAILSGKKRGKLVYRCTSTALKTSSPTFGKRSGIEVLYGGKTANIWGKYNDTEEYNYSGEIADLPDKAINFLLSFKECARKEKTEIAHSFFDLEEINTDRDLLLKIISDVLPGWKYLERDEENKIKFVGACPWQDKHSSNTGSSFDVALLEDVPVVGCWHTGCSNEVAEVHQEIRRAWNEHKNKGAAQNIVEEIPAEIPIEAVRDDSIRSALDGSYDVLLLTAPTGSGKSTEVAKKIAENYQKGERSTFFAPTISLAKRMLQKIRGFLPVDAWKNISLNISGQDEDGEETKIKTDSIKGIAISTYGYLGLSGDRPKLYKIASELIKDRYVYCDEGQEICQKSSIFIPIAARYIRGASTYSLSAKCPIQARRGNCDSCTMGFRKKDVNKNNARHFYKDFDEAGLTLHTQKENISSFFSIQDALDPSKYHQAINTLFIQPITSQQDTSIEEIADGDNTIDYFDFLIRHMQNPHLRCEFCLDEKGNPCAPTEAKTRPVLPCEVPYLAGVSTIPYLQLLAAKKLVIMSATMPSELNAILRSISSKKTSAIQISKTPLKFNISLFKMQKRLSIEKQYKLVKEIADSRPADEIMIVSATKQDYIKISQRLSNRYADRLVKFEFREFLSAIEARTTPVFDMEMPKMYSTYSRSSVMEGFDFPKVVVCIVDMHQYIPRLALLARDEKSILADMLEEIGANIHQILGRLLRSETPINPNECRIEDRQIAILLHGVPERLQGFLINPLLINSLKEYKDGVFVSCFEKKEVKSIASAIITAREGRNIKNRSEMDKEELLQMKKENMSKKAREIYEDFKEEFKDEFEEIRRKKREEKIKELKLKIDALKKEGISDREISRRLHLSRYPEIKLETQ